MGHRIASGRRHAARSSFVGNRVNDRNSRAPGRDKVSTLHRAVARALLRFRLRAGLVEQTRCPACKSHCPRPKPSKSSFDIIRDDDLTFDFVAGERVLQSIHDNSVTIKAELSCLTGGSRSFLPTTLRRFAEFRQSSTLQGMPQLER